MCILLNIKIHFYEVQKDMSYSIVRPPNHYIQFYKGSGPRAFSLTLGTISQINNTGIKRREETDR